MTNGLSSSTNAHLVGIRDKIKISNDGNLEELYKLNKAEQQKALKEVFTVKANNNANAGEKKALEAKASVLVDKLKRLEDQMKDLDKKIAEKEDQINDQVDKIAELMTSAGKKSKEMEDNHRNYVEECIRDVFHEYNRGTIGKDAIAPEIRARIRNSSLASDQLEVQKILGKLDAEKPKVDALIDEAAGWMNEINTFKQQYGVTNSAYKLINRTINQIGNTDTTYTNSDFNTNIPVYSLEKTEVISNLFDNEKLNVLSTNKNYDPSGTNENILNEGKIKDKYKDFLNPKATGGDGNSYNNNAVQKLDEAIQKGLLDDLKASNMSAANIAKFLGENFSNANIRYNGNNRIVIPYGHGAQAQTVFGKVVSLMNEVNKGNRFHQNTWDKDQGNTMDSNNQLKALGENYTDIINKLANGDPKFSFKEAMYALFDKDSGLFKNTGILYDKSKQGDKPNYTIDAAGDADTLNMYKGLASAIKQAWGVDATWIDSAANVGRDGNENGDNSDTDSNPSPVNPDSSPQTIGRSDPLTFRQGDSEFAIVADRNNDGKFTNTQEFVGATGDWKQDMLDLITKYDADGDGKLTGDELKNIKMLKSAYTDNAKTSSGKLNDSKVHETKNDIGYEVTTAFDLGITEINKADIENAIANDRAKDVHGKDKVDVNNSAVFNDSITFKTNDGNITFSRKDDTEEFMKTVYGDAQGKSFELGLSDSEADKEINIAYQEGDKIYNDLIGNKHGKTLDNVNILKNFDSALGETKTLYNNTNDRIQAEEKAMLTKSSNRAAALHNDARNWSSIKSQIQTIAAQRGLNIDMEQAKGIYVTDGSLDAEGIIREYQKQTQNYNDIEQDGKNAVIARDALVKCFKNGVNATVSEINALLKSGKATTADEIVNLLKAQKNTQTEQ